MVELYFQQNNKNIYVKVVKYAIFDKRNKPFMFFLY